MVEKSLVFTGKNGLHARPAGGFVKIAKEHKDANPMVLFNGNEAKATSLVKLLSLGIKSGSEITVTADTEEAVNVLVEFLANVVD